ENTATPSFRAMLREAASSECSREESILGCRKAPTPYRPHRSPSSKIGLMPVQRARHSPDLWESATLVPHAQPHSLQGRLLNLPQPLRQQFLLPQIFRHGNCAFDLSTRLSEPSHLQQQIPANTGQQMVVGQSRVS